MKNHIFLTAALGLLASCAIQMVEKDASDACAAKGKQAFIANAKQTGIPLFIESAHATYVCVGRDDTLQLSNFGAEVITAPDNDGAGIFSVTQRSVADRAGMKFGDIVYEFAGKPVASAAQLRAAIDEVPAGQQPVIKLRRNGKDTVLTAHF